MHKVSMNYTLHIYFIYGQNSLDNQVESTFTIKEYCANTCGHGNKGIKCTLRVQSSSIKLTKWKEVNLNELFYRLFYQDWVTLNSHILNWRKQLDTLRYFTIL